MIKVVLNPEDAVAATSVAALQMARKARLGRAADHGGVSVRGMRERWADTIHGAMAEIAVARAYDHSWTPGGTRVSTGDVGGALEVRATEHANGHLLIYEKDNEDAIFVLAVGHYPEFKVSKRIGCRVAKMFGELRDADPRCWWVSQEAIDTFGY